jgi:hypothetical protein
MKYIISLLLVVAIICIGCAVDSILLNSIHINDIIYRDACSYEVPDDWEIVQNNVDLYAVHRKNSEMYLYEGKFSIREMYISISEPSLFFTECKAKAYLKAYLKDQEPKMRFKK